MKFIVMSPQGFDPLADMSAYQITWFNAAGYTAPFGQDIPAWVKPEIDKLVADAVDIKGSLIEYIDAKSERESRNLAHLKTLQPELLVTLVFLVFPRERGLERFLECPFFEYRSYDVAAKKLLPPSVTSDHEYFADRGPSLKTYIKSPTLSDSVNYSAGLLMDGVPVEKFSVEAFTKMLSDRRGFPVRFDNSVTSRLPEFQPKKPFTIDDFIFPAASRYKSKSALPDEVLQAFTALTRIKNSKVGCGRKGKRVKPLAAHLKRIMAQLVVADMGPEIGFGVFNGGDTDIPIGTVMPYTGNLSRNETVPLSHSILLDGNPYPHVPTPRICSAEQEGFVGLMNGASLEEARCVFMSAAPKGFPSEKVTPFALVVRPVLPKGQVTVFYDAGDSFGKLLRFDPYGRVLDGAATDDAPAGAGAGSAPS